MFQDHSLPAELTAEIGAEFKDFVVASRFANPPLQFLSTIGFSIIWLSFSSAIAYSFFSPIFHGEIMHMKDNGIPVEASIDNFWPLLLPAGFFGLFLLIGVWLLTYSLYKIVQPGGYFVGTPTRLINFRRNKIRSIDWSQFAGDVLITGTTSKGNVYLNKLAGRMPSQQDEFERQMLAKQHLFGLSVNPRVTLSNRYVTEVICMLGISNPHEVGKICRQRIKENAPTLAKSEMQESTLIEPRSAIF